VETWRKTQVTDDTAKLDLYSAFIDGKLEEPRRLLPEVHHLYFEPQYPEFSARTVSGQGFCAMNPFHWLCWAFEP